MFSPAVATARWPASRDRHDAFKARCGVNGFSVHDLRRCAQFVDAVPVCSQHIAERVLGHAVGGVVARTYDRHHYSDEMADALKRLARLITQIVDGEGGKNVVSLRASAVQP